MKQSLIGLLLFIILSLPPVVTLLESIMIVHMHMQMPLLVIAGALFGRYFQIQFPHFWEKWNGNGVPGITLFVIIAVYWSIPRTMDDALTYPSVEVFKFMSLFLLAGVPLYDSWKRLKVTLKKSVFILFTILFLGLGWLYLNATQQLCNNYLLIDQITLGWGSAAMGVCLAIYLLYTTFTDPSKYE
ncbi:hypothetical protein [Pontibacillus sp. HMF3514]|uniref:hypothetical protein n=1 Tax=Pontibacillus sp. HMF3514 TaxID=2692425 RepID=UPI00131FFA36|nr:hypothetical protein [Pontibacillus sp. HMF3514]QHE53836.1 hypothetical protein GS400_18230 [Pontibacillus sp. HMF3514]